MRLACHQVGHHHISDRLVHQAIQLCHHTDTIHQVHLPRTRQRVQIINLQLRYQTIHQTVRTIHQLHLHMEVCIHIYLRV